MDPKKDIERNPEGSAGTIPGRFFLAAAGERPALLFRDGDLVKRYMRRDLETMVKEAALGLLALGICRGERVAILHENGPEWIVPIYTTLGLEETAFILKDSGAVAIVLSPSHIEKVANGPDGHGPDSHGPDGHGPILLKYIISTGESPVGPRKGIRG
jgi:hypothetical protein